MTQRPYRPEPTQTLEARHQIRTLATLATPMFQGWGPKF
jgi:hypothetical protein